MSTIIVTLVIVAIVMAVIVSCVEGVLKARTPFIVALFFFTIWGLAILVLGAPLPDGSVADTSWCFGLPSGLTVLSSIIINKL